MSVGMSAHISIHMSIHTSIYTSVHMSRLDGAYSECGTRLAVRFAPQIEIMTVM